jgi:hypothetical protein
MGEILWVAFFMQKGGGADAEETKAAVFLSRLSETYRRAVL